MMMVPEAYAAAATCRPSCEGFYAYHGCLIEPWDGPAAIAFTDGRVIGATLDRNGLRPGRWLETTDGWVVLASEAGVLRRARREHRAQGPAAARQALPRRPRRRAGSSPTTEVKQRGRDPAAVRRVVRARARAARRPAARASRARSAEPLRRLQLAFGYTQEDMKVMLAPLAANAEEAVGSMGNDTPLAVLSDRRPAPLLVLQAAVRAGDEPADRLDPRGGRDERADARRLRAQPARRDAGARAPARDRQPDPARRGARAAAPGRVGRLQGAHDRHHVAGRRRRRRRSSTRSSASAPRPTRRSPTARTSSILSDRTVGPERVADAVAARDRRPCTTTSSARARACRPGSSSSRASRAACRASRC